MVLWAERRLGELLDAMPKDVGGRPGETGCSVQPVSRLKELSIEKTQSHRWQRIFGLPEPLFVDYLERARQTQKPATQTGLPRRGFPPGSGLVGLGRGPVVREGGGAGGGGWPRLVVGCPTEWRAP